MRCLVLEFNKVNKNNRFYSATTEEVKSLIAEMEAKNRNFLTKGFNPSGEHFTIEKSFKYRFDKTHPDIGFGLRGISKVDKINDIKVEKIKTITCFDLI